MLLEPKLAPCGWRCPHRRPALMGPFGNWYLVIGKGPKLEVQYSQGLRVEAYVSLLICISCRYCLVASGFNSVLHCFKCLACRRGLHMVGRHGVV